MNISRLLDPIKQKIYMLIGRGILTLVNDDHADGTQRVQIMSLYNGTVSDIERFQEYGFKSYPIKKTGDSPDTEGAQVLFASINGNRNQSVAFCIHDRRYEPDYLSEGEVAVYTNLDKTNPHRIHFKDDRSIEINCNVNKINADSDVDINSGANITIDASGTIDITSGGKIIINGNLIDLIGGGGTPKGCITGDSICHFYGGFHLDPSTTVKADK